MKAALVAVLVLGLAAVGQAATMETQTFDSAASAAAAGWTGLGNVVSDPNAYYNFGFSNTDNTGGASPAGEAGGIFGRSKAYAYYADTTLGGSGTVSLAEVITGSGEFTIASVSTPNNGLRIGHFAQGSVAAPFVGLLINEGTGSSTTNVRLGLLVAWGSGSVQDLAVANLYFDGVTATDPWKFEYTWDPAGNGGGGSLAVVVRKASDNSILVSKTLNTALTTGQKSAAVMDAFGFEVNAAGSAITTNRIEAYIDNVSYTVPEPATLAVLAMGGLLALKRRRA